MLAIGNEELGDPLGDTIQCPICGLNHPIQYADRIVRDENGTDRREPSKLLAYYNCGDRSYLAGIDGRAVPAGVGEMDKREPYTGMTEYEVGYMNGRNDSVDEEVEQLSSMLTEIDGLRAENKRLRDALTNCLSWIERASGGLRHAAEVALAAKGE